MPIEVVIRESEDNFEILSVVANLGRGTSEIELHDLGEILDRGGAPRQRLLEVASHIFYYYPISSWSIKVERYDGYVYWLRYDAPKLVERGVSSPASPEPDPSRVSRYRREPVI